jgi:hypothetical protein
MKKVLCALLCAPLMLSGCAGAAYGDEIVDVDALPYDMEVDKGVTLSLYDVFFYQMTDSSGYEYYPIVEVVFDRSKVSDRDMHFLKKDDAGMVSCMISSESNGMEYDDLSHVGDYSDDTYIRYYYMDYMKSQRHDFSDVRVCVDVDPVMNDPTDDKVGKRYSFDAGGEYDNFTINVNNYDKMPENEKLEISVGLAQVNAEFKALTQG